MQLKSLDFNSIRPRLVTLLGTDSSGLEALSMITAYEEYLFSLIPPDTSFRGTPEPHLPNPSGHLTQIYGQSNVYPTLKNILNENFTSSMLPQILRQKLRFGIDQLNDFHLQYSNTHDLQYAKKGVAVGYNALLSGPTISDVPRIAEKMQQLVDSLYAHQK